MLKENKCWWGSEASIRQAANKNSPLAIKPQRDAPHIGDFSDEIRFFHSLSKSNSVKNILVMC